MNDPLPKLETPRLWLDMLDPSWAPRVADYVRANRAFHAPWSPARPENFADASYWTEQLALNAAELRDGRSARFFLVRKDQPHAVIGTCNLSNVVRGAFQACHVGYELAADHTGRGFMTEALAAACDFAFTTLQLHRVMANYRPTNAASANVLKRLGFVVEGYARDYLKIDGAWRDHVLTAKTAPEP